MKNEQVVKKIKPTLYVDEKELPAIKGWKVGSMYNLNVKVEMIRRTEEKEDQPKKLITASLQVMDLKPLDTNKPDKVQEILKKKVNG